MKKILHHIRRQSEETRRHILHVATVVCAIILISLWVYSLGLNFSNEQTQAQVKDGFRPFAVLKDNLSSLW